MKNSYLALICGVLLFIVLSMAWCKPRPQTQTTGLPSATTPLAGASPAMPSASTASPSAAPTASVTQSQSSELRKAAEKTAPAVVQVSVFDALGKLARTGTGFFISDDGKFVASRSLVEGGVNAIATTADNKIYNVTGVLAESPELDVAVLKAEAKQVPFLPLNNVTTSDTGATIAIVGSPLTRRERTITDTKIADRRSDEKGEWFDVAAPLPNEAGGSPVVNENGTLVGLVISDRGKNPPANSVLSSRSLQSFLAKVEPSATPRWAATPAPTPKIVRKGKIIFNPPPVYPSEARGASLATGVGNYRIIFDAEGRAKNVQVLRSSGAPILDRAAVTALQQWKSDPGPEWTVVVPISFQARANQPRG
jgi:TonB family protein